MRYTDLVCRPIQNNIHCITHRAWKQMRFRSQIQKGSTPYASQRERRPELLGSAGSERVYNGDPMPFHIPFKIPWHCPYKSLHPALCHPLAIIVMLQPHVHLHIPLYLFNIQSISRQYRGQYSCKYTIINCCTFLSNWNHIGYPSLLSSAARLMIDWGHLISA